MKTINVHPKPGVTIHLPGSSTGFNAEMAAHVGGVPMREDHAQALAEHLHLEAAPAAPNAE